MNCAAKATIVMQVKSGNPSYCSIACAAIHSLFVSWPEWADSGAARCSRLQCLACEPSRLDSPRVRWLLPFLSETGPDLAR